ncbi:universal stress protein [Jeongeupia naejangsanensis]|uniref:Universal stress protein n=1 Tax=Jeongeupia naejangsanensis TaxID=613195 RepID=A0ABS2BIG4_9NEIS|nr:universal stress protein [Jeongeupia naejangsanensis]MBM3114604.1 universal stress protein [Jeongeupia naejangsanensis]
MYDRILVPVDGSDTSNHGLREALRLAKRLGAELRLLHVVDPQLVYIDFGGMVNVNEYVESIRNAGRDVLAEALKIAEAEGVPTDAELREKHGGTVADLVLAEAKKWKAGMIVMGTHGRRGIRHLVMGSDAMGVVREATVPVVVVRDPAAS